MLWVNGYSGALAQLFKLAPKTGRAYWGKNIHSCGYLLKDWNWMFIDPDTSLLSTPAIRFKAGYHFAIEHDRIIRNNIILSGNILQIVAHGAGVAFAEGIASYFYEEKGIVTDLAIYIQGSNMSSIPQSRRAVECRIITETKTDFLRNRRGSLRFKDVTILESDLKNGFCKYEINLENKEFDQKTSNLYFKRTDNLRLHRNMHFYRPFALWSSIDHALKMYIESEIDSVSTKIENVRDVMFEKYTMN
jgi:hypothetical protein